MSKKTKPEANGTTYKASEIEPIFGLAKINDKVKITLGENLISNKEFDTFEDAEKYIESKPYELILNSAVVLLKFTQNNEKEQTKKAN